MNRSQCTGGQGSAAMLAIAAVGAALVALSVTIALMAAPALVLLAILVAGHFPGERLIGRLRGRRPHLTNGARPAPLPRLALVTRPTGLSLSYALAMRPPPAAA